jgi:hypothetical protein
MQWPTELVTKDQVVRAVPRGSDRETLRALLTSMQPNRGTGLRIQVDNPAALERLGRAHNDVVADGGKRLDHRQLAAVQIDVRPSQAEDRIPVVASNTNAARSR